MTPSEMPPHDESCSGDVAAYALGALDATEAQIFEAHLRSCAVCPNELAAFQQVVDDLAISAPHRPAPAALRRRVMRAIAEDQPRLDPVARHERRRSRLRLALPRPALALSTGLAVIVAAVLVAVFALPGGSSTRTIDAQVTGGGSAALKLSGGHAQLVVHHFPEPPHGKIYEVWLQRGQATPSPTTALFSVTGSGDGDVEVPGSLKGVSHVLVTPEPAGGSKIPTHAPVISATLSQ
jgi:anti-sigma-K factor RskA